MNGTEQAEPGKGGLYGRVQIHERVFAMPREEQEAAVDQILAELRKDLLRRLERKDRQ